MNRFSNRKQLVGWIAGVAAVLALGIVKICADGEMALPIDKADFYVASDGKDSNPGTAGAPFATLTRARDAVRAKIAHGLSLDVLVLIRGGIYSQTKTLTFGPEDSGTDKHSITYAAAPGEHVIISGGERVTGWKKGTGEIWTTKLSDVKAGKWYFRQLFVNGNRAVRARTPNVNSVEPWSKMLSSTADGKIEDQAIIVKLGGYEKPFIIKTYNNPEDVELVYICNNEMGRKRLGAVDEKNQSFSLRPPHRWNSKDHGNDWYLSFPDPRWKACYLENALEMLDQPGEWYLNRATGILSYWPRQGEDLTKAEVVAPVAQKTLLAVIGTRDEPVRNLHFDGIHIEYLDWVPPEWGYMGLFCCTTDTGPTNRLRHGFIDAGLEFEYARSCNFINGGIAHVGGMGLCLRRGTAGNIIEGNEICDTAAGGIGVSEIRQTPMDKRSWNPLPRSDDYQSYRIANNHIHHCGSDYYGAAGITLFMMQDSVVAHNLIHDTAYSGIQWAGDCPGQSAFTRNNTVEFNDIYNAMLVTCDGAGMYVTYRHGGETVIRRNLIHDTRCNPFRRGEYELHKTDIPCFGLYLDSNMSGGLYENNIVYNNAGGPLILSGQQTNNIWHNNLFLKNGTLPGEYIDVMQAFTGLEPAYQKSLLNTEPNPCQYSVLIDLTATNGWAAYQFHLPIKNCGVVEIVQPTNHNNEAITIKPLGLNAGARYAIKEYIGTLSPADQTFYLGTLLDENARRSCVAVLGDLPILSGNVVAPASELGLPIIAEGSVISGKNLLKNGLQIKLGESSEVIWIAYKEVM